MNEEFIALRDEMMLVLENEGELHKEFIKKTSFDGRRGLVQLFGRRTGFRSKHNFIKHSGDNKGYYGYLSFMDAVIWVTKRLEERWLGTVAIDIDSDSALIKNAIDGWTDFILPSEPQETQTMQPSTAPFINTVTYVQGQDISKMTDQQIYAVIAAKEGEIEALEKIKNQPNKLKKQIEQIKADINALVDLVNKQDAPAAE